MEDIDVWNEKLFNILDEISPIIKNKKLLVQEEIIKDGVVGIFNREKNKYLGFSLNQLDEKEGFGVSICDIGANDEFWNCKSVGKLESDENVLKMVRLVEKNLSKIY